MAKWPGHKKDVSWNINGKSYRLWVDCITYSYVNNILD